MLAGDALKGLCGQDKPWMQPAVGLDDRGFAEAGSGLPGNAVLAVRGRPGEHCGGKPGSAAVEVTGAGQDVVPGVEHDDERATWRTATRPGARFRRLARRFGKGNEKKAAIAVAHTLLSTAWAVMRYDADYIDAGAGYYQRRDQRNREHLVRYHQNALARLGLQVIITQPGDGAPPPPSPQNPGQAA